MTQTPAHVTPRRPSTGSQQRAERTRALVIDETVRCIREEGFGAASAKHITERAGVTWGVIQYHFGDRDALLMAVVDVGFGQLIQILRELEPRLAAMPDQRHTELVVDAVWRAFSSPTSLAAMEILVATRPGRSVGESAHIRQLHAALTDIARHLGAGLDAEHAHAVGDVIWTMLRGSMLALMVAGGTAEGATLQERRALVDVIDGYLDHQRCR